MSNLILKVLGAFGAATVLGQAAGDSAKNSVTDAFSEVAGATGAITASVYGELKNVVGAAAKGWDSSGRGGRHARDTIVVRHEGGAGGYVIWIVLAGGGLVCLGWWRGWFGALPPQVRAMLNQTNDSLSQLGSNVNTLKKHVEQQMDTVLHSLGLTTAQVEHQTEVLDKVQKAVDNTGFHLESVGLQVEDVACMLERAEQRSLMATRATMLIQSLMAAIAAGDVQGRNDALQLMQASMAEQLELLAATSGPAREALEGAATDGTIEPAKPSSPHFGTMLSSALVSTFSNVARPFTSLAYSVSSGLPWSRAPDSSVAQPQLPPAAQAAASDADTPRLDPAGLGARSPYSGAPQLYVVEEPGDESGTVSGRHGAASPAAHRSMALHGVHDALAEEAAALAQQVAARHAERGGWRGSSAALGGSSWGSVGISVEHLPGAVGVAGHGTDGVEHDAAAIAAASLREEDIPGLPQGASTQWTGTYGSNNSTKPDSTAPKFY